MAQTLLQDFAQNLTSLQHLILYFSALRESSTYLTPFQSCLDQQQETVMLFSSSTDMTRQWQRLSFSSFFFYRSLHCIHINLSEPRRGFSVALSSAATVRRPGLHTSTPPNFIS